MEIVHETPNRELTEYGFEFFLMELINQRVATCSHIHPAIEFLYIKKGLFDIDVERKHIMAGAGDLVLFHSNATHTIMNPGESEGAYYVLKLAPTYLFNTLHKSVIPDILPFLHNQTHDVCHVPKEALPQEICRQWQAMIAEYNTKARAYVSMQHLLACEFLLTCARLLLPDVPSSALSAPELNARTACLIYESIGDIKERFSEPLTATACAAHIHLSYSHYARLFRAVVGKSFKEYLTDIRMAEAYNLLFTTPRSVSDIAPSCGYDSLSYFIAEFKKYYGRTPGDLRRDFHRQNKG